MDGGGVSADVGRSVRVLIEAQPSAGVMFAATPFEPQLSDDSPPRSSNEAGGAANHEAPSCSAWDGVEGAAAAGPERKLTLLALRLAILEKAASGLGAPVVGDGVYGKADGLGMMLHAQKLIVPRAGKTDVVAEAPLPERFAKAGFADDAASAPVAAVADDAATSDSADD
jgi:hypothetical protein